MVMTSSMINYKTRPMSARTTKRGIEKKQMTTARQASEGCGLGTGERSLYLAYRPTLTEHGFTLHKSAFHDALALRYGWTPSRLPSKCECSN